MTVSTSTNWTVNPEACEGSGVTDLCTIYNAQNNDGRIQVIQKTLACGCVLTRDDEEGVEDNGNSN